MSADYVITLKLARLLDTASKFSFALFLVSGLKDEKSIKSKPTWKLEAYKLYSREMWTFLQNVIKIDSYNIELCRFKVGAFFLRHGVLSLIKVSVIIVRICSRR